MRNFKRFLALVLAMLMLSSMMIFSTGAAEVGDYTEAAKRLSAIGILKGDGAGNLMLNAPVNRWQTALFFMQVMTGTTEAEKLNAIKTSAYFTDVVEYGSAIDQAYGFGVVKGRGNGIYGYNDSIIYQDMLVMAVRALGYETEDMAYPYGHILAADKLGLTNNMDIVDFKKPLTRGETAQIIWNTLITDIAAKDPVTDKILYPGDTDGVGTLLGISVPRENFLERSKFAQDDFDGVVVDFIDGAKASDMDIVVIDVDGEEFEFNADDLGIDDFTPKSYFLGLPVSIFVDCAEADFFDKYNVDPELSEAKVVFTDLLPTSYVENIGADGTIKCVLDEEDEIAYIELDGQKYKSEDYLYDIRVFTENGWESDDGDAYTAFTSNLLWDKEDGYIGENSYGAVEYAVVTDEESGDQTLYVLYMPYTFGRYAERSIVYQPEGTAMSVITMARYTPGISYKNHAGIDTDFVEYTLGKNGVKVDKDTKSVSKKAGELSVNVTVDGVEVSTHDYVFYYYNELDNILTIAYNCGGTQTGRLTSYSSSKETVKIGGTNYKLGFTGVYTSNLPDVKDFDKIETDYLDNLEAGLNNVHYILEGENVIFTAKVDNTDNAKHKYLIISTDSEIMAELLDMDVEDYEEEVEDTLGVYVDQRGDVKVAVLGTTTGEWALETIEAVDIGEYDAKEDEYAQREDLAEHLENYAIFDEAYKNLDDLEEALAVLDAGIVMVRESSSGKHTVAAISDDYIDFGTEDSGLYFSDKKAVTNKIKATKDEAVTKSRKTLNGDSVVVVIDAEGNVGVRTGIQAEKNTIKGKGRFYTATNALIVFQLDGASTDVNGNDLTVADWAAAVDVEDAYYVALADSSVAVEANEDGTYTLTFENLFNLKAFDVVPTIDFTVDSLTETDVDTDFAAGKVILKTADSLNYYNDGLNAALLEAINGLDDEDEDFFTVDMSAVDFVDEESITITFENDDDDIVLDARDAVNYIDIMLATINVSEVDFEKYDIDEMAYVLGEDEVPEYLDKVNTVRLNSDNDRGYEYALTGLNQSMAVSSPENGKLNNYIIKTAGEEILIAEKDGTYYEDAASAVINLYGCGRFDEKDGNVILYVIKVIKDAD